MKKYSPDSNREPSFPELSTSRLLLREFHMQDAPAVFDIFRLEVVNRYLETELMQSIEDAERRVMSRISLFREHMGCRWAVTLRDNPSRVIGSCGYFSVRRGTQTVEAGYELHPEFWNKGLMTEAVQAMIRFSFGPQDLMPVHRIEALVTPENTASIRILEKLGFEREGLRREFGFWQGRYQDVFLYALLDHGKDASHENPV